MAEIISQRNKTLMDMVSTAGGRMADLVRWPESAATKDAAESAIKALRKELRECGYPHGLVYLMTMQVASIAYNDALSGDVAIQAKSLKAAWIKIGDLLHNDTNPSSVVMDDHSHKDGDDDVADWKSKLRINIDTNTWLLALNMVLLMIIIGKLFWV